MSYRLFVFTLGSLLASACNAGSPGDMRSAPLSWSEVQARPLPAAGERIAYGTAPQQFGELRVPAGAGPFPVLVLIHGGCWLNAFDYRYFSHLADALTRKAGVATWNIEFRRLGDTGGGWPGTLLDVAEATDHLRELAGSHRLDLKRVVSVGHSAGGHLALWLAARPKLPRDSELYRPDPLALRGVIGLAPITDLAAYGAGPGGCHSAVGELLGGTPRERAQRYKLSSPRELLPLGTAQWLIQGSEDPIVPANSVHIYAEAAIAAADGVSLELTTGAGHFEPAMPGTASWPALLDAVVHATVKIQD
ncbi:MAG: alpha/beta hydrolase family protein [Panacagrimonas sp.]